MKTKTVVILRGVSGSGKSSFAELIAEPKVICCADFYFEQDGSYNFDASKLGQAHLQSRKTFDDALNNPYVDNIVVANTNVKPSDYQYYVTEAEKRGVRVTFVVLEKRHNNESLHDVPPHVLERQAESIEQDMKLI